MQGEPLPDTLFDPLFGDSAKSAASGSQKGSSSYVVVDNFWFRSLAGTRTSSLVSNGAPEVSGGNIDFLRYPAARTVSEQARENDTNDLILDDSDPSLYTPDSHRTVSESTTASENERNRGGSLKRVRIMSSLRPVSEKLSEPSYMPDSMPKLHLGETGRQKLKSMISQALKYDEELRIKVSRIGKVKLASIPQLLAMAKVCGLWDEVLRIAASVH